MEKPNRQRSMQMYHIMSEGNALETCMTSETAFKKAKDLGADQIELVNISWDSTGESTISRQTVWSKKK
jgi:hypothetical protein